MESLRSSRSRSRSPWSSNRRLVKELDEIAPDAPDVPLRRSAFVTMATGAYLHSAMLLVIELRRQLDQVEENRSVENAQKDDDAGIDVVLFTDAQQDINVPPGIVLRELGELQPLPSTSHLGEPMFPHFRFCWQKLGLWALDEYEIVVYLDADIFVMGDVMPLLRRDLRAREVAAVPACQCWHSDTCSYTDGFEKGLQTFEFNAGVLVLRTARCTFNAMVDAVKATKEEYPFAEQDFLNEFFRGHTLALHPRYNMLKFAFTNPKHSKVINLANCVCLHFIMAKPWERASKIEDEFAELHKTWLDASIKHETVSAKWRQWPKHALDVGALQSCIHYLPCYSTLEEARKLLSEIHCETMGSRWQQLRQRRLQCWGGVPHPEGSFCESLPSFLLDLGNDLQSAGAFAKAPNQYLVNTYSSGQGIDAHFDGPLFLPVVAILTLEGQALLRFKLVDKLARPDLPERFEVFLQPMSLLLFRGDAYNLYVHSIAHSQSDIISELCVNCQSSGTVVGQEVSRAVRRTSITMRLLRNVKMEPSEVEKDSRLILERQKQWDWWTDHLREFD